MKSKNALCGLTIAVVLQFGELAGSAQTNIYLFSGSETNITLSPGTYIITACGAPGGRSFYETFTGTVGSPGAEMSAEFNFSASATLTLLVGGGGGSGSAPSGAPDSAGGGGGSFVVEGSAPLVIAGGGGGDGGSRIEDGGQNGNVSANGGLGGDYNNKLTFYTGALGGTNGGGGAGGLIPIPQYGGGTFGWGPGGGGGGFLGNGGDGEQGEPSGYGGLSYAGGGYGGGGGSLVGTNGGGGGGYGGGGGGGYSGGGGGGGGYSGGGGGNSYGPDSGGGGGGGSIIDSSAITILTEVSGIASPDDPANGEIIIIAVPTPLAITPNATVGFTNGVFGFNLIGPSGSNVVIQASTDLQTWIPLQTNLFGSGPLHFSDTQSPANVHRFYRAQIWP